MANPRRRTRRRAAPVAARPRRRPRDRNPFRPRRRQSYALAPYRRRTRNSRRRGVTRNPSLGGAKSFAVEGAKAVVSAAVSSVASRAIVQGVLGDKNTGMLGYLGNLVVAFGGGFALWKFTKSYSIAIGWACGGGASTVQRIWSEKVSQTSPSPVSGLGDLDYSSNGLGGIGLSGFVNTPYALPSITGADGTVQSPFTAAALPPAVTAAGGSAAPGGTVAMIPNANATRFQPRY